MEGLRQIISAAFLFAVELLISAILSSQIVLPKAEQVDSMAAAVASVQAARSTLVMELS
jgi:hypothetical protein